MPSSLRDIKLKKANENNQSSRPEIVPTKDHDKIFVQNLIQTVRKWLNNETHDRDIGTGDDDRGSIYSGSEAEDVQDDLSGIKFNEEYLQLEPVNAYQRALQYQTLRNTRNFNADDPPGFYIERVENNYGRVALKLIRASSTQVAAMELEEKQKQIDAITTAASFCHVIELMRDSRKPAVGHNLSFDVAYTLHSFAKPLPPTWIEFKDRVKKWFPGGVYDTKYIASVYNFLYEDTSLGAVYTSIQLDAERGSRPQRRVFENDPTILEADVNYEKASWEEVRRISIEDTIDFPKLPRVKHADGFRRYVDANRTPPPGRTPTFGIDSTTTNAGIDSTTNITTTTTTTNDPKSTGEVGSTNSYAHEAGYDAYMTGFIFAGFLTLLWKKKNNQEEEEENGWNPGDTTFPLSMYSFEAVEEYCWKMNVSRSDMGYAALWGPDNVMPRNNIFFLTRIDPGMYRHGGDIVKKLKAVKELLDGAFLRVHVLGHGGTTALLELPIEVAENEEMLQHVKVAVEKSIPGCCVKNFDEYRTVKAMQRAGMDDLMIEIGNDNRKTEDGGVAALPAKRPRIGSTVQERRQHDDEEQLDVQTATESTRCSIM
jgi:hypothetical protein